MAQAIRNSYKVIMDQYEKAGKGTVRLTQSSILLIRDIDPAKNSYDFPLLETDSPQTIQPEEIRLNMNDEFISYDVSYYLLADVHQVDTPANVFSKMYLPYAPIELDFTFVTLAKAWDSYLAITVNKISRLEKWDMKKHNFIPRTQFKSVDTGLPYATIPNIDYSENGSYSMQPMLTMSGAKKTGITLTLTNGAIPLTGTGILTVPYSAAVDPATTQDVQISANRLALFFRGMLAQNASSFQ